jgi:hypothetical protein
MYKYARLSEVVGAGGMLQLVLDFVKQSECTGHSILCYVNLILLHEPAVI